MKINLDPLLKSVSRLTEGIKGYEQTGAATWRGFIRKESTILLRRAFKLWWNVRFRRW